MSSEILPFQWPVAPGTSIETWRRLWPMALAQVEKDLEMSGARLSLAPDLAPHLAVMRLATWMAKMSPEILKRFLYRMDVPEPLQDQDIGVLAIRCFQRALLKVWLREKLSDRHSPGPSEEDSRSI
ncbi:MAG: hypothetical protein NZM15_08930 [Flavobacteriales bacterium]|nr:hypothetical protein [Flavobacteriales bacterium]MDW8432812.1 hypothetical protein [Flavobacteriales bacterium]